MRAFDVPYQEILDNLTDGVYFVDKNRKIIYWNKAAETITGFLADEVVGNNCSNNILNHVDENGYNLCCGACPLAATISDRRIRENVIYLHHKQGHRIPVLAKTIPLLNTKQEVVGGIEVFVDNSSKKTDSLKLRELAKRAFIDGVTGLVNQAYCELKLASMLGDAQKALLSFGVLIIDIDDIKDADNKYSSSLDDKVITTVAKTLMANTDELDIVSRWYDGFLVIATNIRKSTLLLLANKLQSLIAQSTTRHNDADIHFTVSVGGTVAVSNDNIASLVGRAYRQLAYVKSSGRKLPAVNEEF